MNLPLTAAAIDRLNWKQTNARDPDAPRRMCPNSKDDFHHSRGLLVATRRGWICPFCDYAEDYAHTEADVHAESPSP